ncbi:hypothetical protein RB195_021753 [Necator americanus]|uniref:Uncharacterized protein n=1 Tax=Necator americanus TaxID=51031 RepID=A0ABR1ECM1_NECAM
METDFTHKIVIELNSGTIFSFEGMVDRCVMTSMYWQCFLVVIIAIMGIAITSVSSLRRSADVEFWRLLILLHQH